jgi:hypothetical protein
MSQKEYLKKELSLQLEAAVNCLERDQRFNQRYLRSMITSIVNAYKSLESGDMQPALKLLPKQPRDPNLGNWSHAFHGRLGFLYNQGGV